MRRMYYGKEEIATTSSTTSGNRDYSQQIQLTYIKMNEKINKQINNFELIFKCIHKKYYNFKSLNE
jgi:hypothetical protein